MLLLYFVVAGVALGWLAGGRLSALNDVRFRWWGLALGGLAFQVLLFSPLLGATVGDAGPPLYVASTVAVLVSLLANVRLVGFPIIAIGAALNLIVVLANGGQMPADPALFQALTGRAAVPSTLFSNSTLIGPDTVLPFLGDIFLLPRPFPFANVFSIGDVLIGVGAVVFLVATMRRGRRPSPTPEAIQDGGAARQAASGGHIGTVPR